MAGLRESRSLGIFVRTLRILATRIADLVRGISYGIVIQPAFLSPYGLMKVTMVMSRTSRQAQKWIECPPVTVMHFPAQCLERPAWQLHSRGRDWQAVCSCCTAERGKQEAGRSARIMFGWGKGRGALGALEPCLDGGRDRVHWDWSPQCVLQLSCTW
jgi:hypothetical protein